MLDSIAGTGLRFRLTGFARPLYSGRFSTAQPIWRRVSNACLGNSPGRAI